MNNFLYKEKISREKSEEAFLKMIKTVILKLQSDLEKERLDRENSEEMLLNLLEHTCNKIDEISEDL